MERFDSNIWTLDEYIETYNGITHTPQFKGVTHYKLLIKNDFLIPDYSIIRIDADTDTDGYYALLNDFNLVGMDDESQPGTEGVHEYKQILSNAVFEAYKLNIDLYCNIDRKKMN